MAEILNEEVVATETATEATEPTIDEFEGWDDESTESADEWDKEESTADNNEESDTETVTEETTPSAEDDVNAPETETQTEEPTETYQFLETKYNKETKKFDLGNPEEKDMVVKLIQKGQNYDKVLNERDTLKAANAELKYLKESLEAIKGQNYGSGYDLLDDALAENLVKAEADNGRVVSKEEALKRVIANRESVMKEATPPSDKELKQKSIEEFAKAYPKLNPQEIPKSVWDEFEETSDLISAYRTFESGQKDTAYAELQKKLESVTAELNQMKLNEKNRTRSTGSQKTSGKAPLADPDFDGWVD